MKSLPVVVSLLLILLASGCTDSKVFKGEGFEIQYPENWSKTESENSVVFTSPLNAGLNIETIPSEGEPLDTYIKNIKEARYEMSSSLVFEPEKTIRIPLLLGKVKTTVTGKQLIYTTNSGSKKIKVFETITKFNNTIYRISFVSSEENYSKEIKEVNESLATFTIIRN